MFAEVQGAPAQSHTAPPYTTLAKGLNLPFTPGIYDVDKTITVKNANTVVSVGMAALLSLSTQLDQSGAQRPPESQVGFVVTAVTVDIFFAQMIVAVLGVMAVTGEYSTGVIKASLAAVPKRLPMLPAKAIVVFVATYLVGLGGNLASYLVASPILSLRDVDASLLGLQRGRQPGRTCSS